MHAKMNHKTFCFHVYDSGIGISKEKQGKLFECFVQGDDSSTRSYGQLICIYVMLQAVDLHLCYVACACMVSISSAVLLYMHKTCIRVQGDESKP